MASRVCRRMSLLALAILSLPAFQAGTGILAGRVTAADVPLAGVTVRAVRAGETVAAASAVTDTDGAFRFEALPQGVYRLELRRDGYQPATRPGVVVFAGATETVLIGMTPVDGAVAAPAASVLSSLLGPGEVGVRIETPLGLIFLAIDTRRAPVTAANFLKYVDAGLYDGGRFHRATRPDNYTPAPPNRPMMELIQGGINPNRRADAFPPIPLERTSVTGLTHVRGTVSMARGAAADTATSDFFILLDDQPSLDFGGRRFDDEQGAAAFGRVVAGLDVVRRIQQQPVEGQNLSPPVPIIRAVRFE